MIAGPASNVGVPAVVREVAGGAVLTPVWRNEMGGLTFEFDVGSERRFVKWTPAASGIDLYAEVVRLRWAAGFCPVPTVLAHGNAGNDGSWLLTRGLAGDNAVRRRWSADPRTAVTAIGTGLRTLHDTLPVAQCPFTWSAPDRVIDALHRGEAGVLDPGRWHAEHRAMTVVDALAQATQTPSVDRLVVCHGDACAPNTLIGPTGGFAGHVDLGSLGTADRWADLAVATWSTQWNYGPGWEPLLLDAYGVAEDRERIAYYRLLWDLGP